MPVPIAARRFATSVGALAVTGTLLLAGCGGDGGEKGPSEASAASESAGPIDQLVADGLSQLEAGELDEAGRTFEAVLLIEADNAYAHYNLGFIAQQRGDTGLAIERYNDAITSDPEMAPALYNLAILTEQADLEASVDLYRRVLATRPDDAATHMRLGFALRHLGRTAEGEKALAKGVQLDPSMADVTPPSYSG